MKIFVAIAFVLAAFSAAAADSFQAAASAATPTHPALYSFADVYRLTVSGSPVPVVATESPLRVAAAQSAVAPELQYAVVHIAEPQRWMLLLAGLALALWVARRRLGYAS